MNTKTLLVLASAAALAAQSAGRPQLTHGVASGDVTATSAVVWARADAAATLEVEYDTDPAFARARGGPSQPVTAATDFTGQVLLEHLEPATRYHYRVRASSPSGRSAPRAGSFVTAPRAGDARDVSFLWAGDLGGQGFCRKPDGGYTIFRGMKALEADFTLFAGDMIYADSPCPSPPNLPGCEAVAATLEDYRQRWRYNRADADHMSFLESTSMVTQWDDHEVRNDFAGPSDPLMPLGRQAYFEYHPMTRDSRDPRRMYRNLRWGRELELFVLDNRQYRDPNAKPDGPDKTMLGRAQREWLTQALAASDAVWKVLATSVPLTVPTGGEWRTRGRDGWSNGTTASDPAGHPTGWEHELLEIFRFIRERRIANVIWITTDVHFAQVAKLDPFEDGNPTGYELISGPLSAVKIRPGELDTSLRPTRLYAEGELFNFGRVHIDARTHRLTAEIRAPSGASGSEVRFHVELDGAGR